MDYSDYNLAMLEITYYRLQKLCYKYEKDKDLIIDFMQDIETEMERRIDGYFDVIANIKDGTS